MRQLNLTEPAWENVRQSILHKYDFTGAFVLTGPSEQMSNAVNELLADARQQQRIAHYFLSSGSQIFHVPCYTPILPVAQNADQPGIYDVLENCGFLKPLEPDYTSGHVLNTLKEAINQHPQTAQFILLECITPLRNIDRLFLTQLVQSNLAQRVPVLVCIHQEEKTQQLAALNLAEGLTTILYALYLCGGRLAQRELDIMIESCALTVEQLRPYLRQRQTTTETWWSYRSSRLPKQLEQGFSILDNESKMALVRRILPQLSLRFDYPLLTIASYAGTGAWLTSHYMLNIVKLLLATTPRDLLPYFRNLRSYAKQEQQHSLFLTATVNDIALLLLLKKGAPTHIYQLLCDSTPQDQQTALAHQALFFSIGQIFSREKNPQHLDKASDCYQRCLKIIANTEQIAPEDKKRMLASIANGAALVAYKQGNAAKALQLENSGLREIEQIDKASSQPILLKTHRGDLLFRSFDKLDEAIIQYEEAYALATKEVLLEARLYVAPRLARAYIRTQAFTRAIEVLETLLAAWKQQPFNATKKDVHTHLEILLPLAQAYLSAQRFHDAALCYLQLFLEPEGISPTVLRGIARNLRHCVARQPDSFWVWVEEVITGQEQLLVDIEQLSQVLAV